MKKDTSLHFSAQNLPHLFGIFFFLVAVFLLLVQINTVQAQTNVSIDFRKYVQDPDLQKAVYDAMHTRPTNVLPGQRFAITSDRHESNWWAISIASLDGPGCSLNFVGSAKCGGLLIAFKDDVAGWRAALEKTTTFSGYVTRAPSSLISSSAKAYLGPLSNKAPVAASVVYKFPWTPGTWNYWRGWVQEYTSNALDIGTTGTDKRILASADGAITYICRGTNTANVRVLHADGVKLEYWHIDLSQLGPEIKELYQVQRGQLLGILRSGSWAYDTCGQAQQNAGSAHIHWVLPTDRAFTADGWTIQSPDDAWRKGTLTIVPNASPYQTITSTNYILLPQWKPFEMLYPIPGDWPYLLQASDDRIRKIEVDGNFSFWPGEVGCGSTWYNATQGSHLIRFWYEYRDNWLPKPTINIDPWPLSVLIPPPCAGSPTNPPDSNPVKTDSATFISHITVPDGTAVSSSQSMQKTWKVRNTGTSTWNGFKLMFLQGDQMGGTSPVSIGTTPPGQEVDLTVSLQAPSTSGNKVGYWQIINKEGVHVPGGKLSVNVNVVGSTGGVHIAAFTASPSSPSNASTVRLYARVNWWPQFRAMRVKVDGQSIGETSTTENTFNWNTSTTNGGDHSIVLEVADQTDTSWSHPEQSSMIYTFQGNPSPANHAPNRPTLIANPAYDWYVTIGNPPQLCAQTTDPDAGDTVQYQFEASASVGTYNSGWVGNCYTFPSVNPGTYQWHAKARDNRGLESDWSDYWHFSVQGSGVSINMPPSITPGSPSTSERIDFCLTTSGHAGVNIDVRALVNTASDGSESGTWNYLDGYLPGGGQWCWWWNTLEYGDGNHKVRFDARAWQPAASDVQSITYNLQHRRPASPRLLAPVPATGNIREAVYSNSRTIAFRWQPTIRATNYTLHIDTGPAPKDAASPVFRQTFAGNVTEYTVTFSQDYPTLYWQVTATNDAGTNASGDQLFGIDRVASTCAVQSLAATTYDNVFQVSWNGIDGLAGVRSFDIQYMDSGRGEWANWALSTPASKTYDLFTGAPGHIYSFRCRATDNAGNTGTYPSIADTSIRVDPAGRPQTPWWNTSYTGKRNLTILNNMPSLSLSTGYPVHLHFDSGTVPSATDLYNASQSNPKCNDLRIIYNDTTELDRYVQNCSTNSIDIWFRTQVSIAGSASNNTAHQLYYGNPSAGSPPANPGSVFQPGVDGNTVAAWYMIEGQGSTVYDQSGNNLNCSLDSTTSWTTSPKFIGALHFQSGTGGPTAYCGTSSLYNLQNFTYEFYFRSTQNNLWGRMAGNLQSNSQRWVIDVQDNKPSVDIWTTNGERRVTVTQALADGAWHHYAFTVSGTQVNTYVDGQLNATGTLPANIRSDNLPFTIGSAENIMRSFAEITGARLSNTVRMDFSHGAFVQVTNEPSIAAGTVIAPPITGTPDLAVLSLAAYPNSGSGLLVQSVVRNQGNLDTQDGFFVDLYSNHQPTGSGDYSNIGRFWISNPIAAGSTITITTVLTDATSVLPRRVRLASTTEMSGTLYVQADSVGLVKETNRGNNISGGTQVCVASADAFEGTGTPSNLLLNGSVEDGQFSQTGSPTAWTRDIWGNATLTWDNAQAYQGSKSVKINATSPDDARWVQTVSVQPYTNYRLSARIKTSNVAHSTESVDAGANLSLNGTWTRSGGLFGTNDWTYVAIDFNSDTMTQVQVAARLGFWSGTTTGTVWFDDIRLVPLDPITPGDGQPSLAQPITIGQTQSHNFNRSGDQDWVKFTAQSSATYAIQTSNLAANADTYLFLYDQDGATLLASNDDYGATLASRVDWTAPAAGTYFVMVRHWNPSVGGCGTSYDLTISRTTAGGNSIFLPFIRK